MALFSPPDIGLHTHAVLRVIGKVCSDDKEMWGRDGKKKLLVREEKAEDGEELSPGTAGQ